LKKIVITGAAGFIGSNLVDKLIDKGYFIYGLDNLITGSLKNLNHLQSNNKFEFVEHDVTKFISVKDNIDYVFHLASPASPIDYLNYPIQTLKANAIGGHNALGLAKKNNAKFILASTSEVYGDPAVHPQPESYWGNVNPIGIRSCYDEGKRAAETLFMDYHRQNGVDIRIVRIFNTFGPRMNPDDGRVVSNFICQALRGQDITIYGDGKQTRSFCYVDDLIEGFVRLMNQDELTGPINIGNPGEFTMLELADKVLAKVGGSSKLVFEPLPGDDPQQRQPDITLAKKHLGWEPTISLDEGLDRTIAYFKTVV